MSINSKMTAIADEIRTLSGTTGIMGLDTMATNIGDANDEVSTQTDLLAQIASALEGKASASEPVLQTKTVTPTTSAQNVTPDSGYDGFSKVTVNAIPSTYVKPTSTKAATTYTPTTSNQTIAAGTYCSGVQTIKGDANLKAENIKSGVSIFGITGTASSGGGSGGASVETCTGEIIVDAPNFDNFTVYAMDANLQVSTLTIDKMMGGTFTVAKGTIFAVTPWSNMESGVSGNCSECYYSSFGAAFVASGDFTLAFRG